MNIKRLINKIFALVALTALFISFNTKVFTTLAYFSDVEESSNNILRSSDLDLEIENTVETYDPVTAGENVEFTADFKNTGQLSFDYDQKYNFVSGDEALCQQLHLTVTGDSTTVYDGLLKDYILNSSQSLASGLDDLYNYKLEIPENTEDVYINMNCNFNLSSYAFQPEIGVPLVGFWDEENFDVSISSGVWQSCHEDEESWATEISAVFQGTRNDGSGIDLGKSDPDAVLYEPDGSAFSLGVGGTITAKLKYPAKNKPGADIAIHEVTEDAENVPLERAHVEVSYDDMHWYAVGDVTSRDGGDGIGMVDISSTGLSWVKYVRLTDVTDYAGQDSDADGYDADAIAGLYATCGDPEQMVCTTVAGFKKNTETDSGIENWEVVLHPATQEPAQVLNLSANNPNPVSSMNLANGRKYLIEVSGTWLNGQNRLVDANFYSDDNWTNQGNLDDDAARDPRQLDVLIDDSDVDWGTYNTNHLYKKVVVGEDAALGFRIYDEDQDPTPPSWYQDNNGSLTIRIYDMTDQVVTTDVNGQYSKEVCGTYYQVLEVPQDGWIQQYPTSPSYYHIDLRQIQPGDSFDFGNKPAPIVINEVYYRGSKENEFVELYNPTNQEVTLKGWSIAERYNDSEFRSDVIPDLILKPRGFALIVTDPTNVSLHPLADPQTPIVSIGADIGNGLNDDLGYVILKNEVGIEVDKMAYGSDVSYWDPAPSAPSGSSLNRIPKGFDTNQASDWQINPIPNPGTNPHQYYNEVEEEVAVNSSQQEELIIENNTEENTEEQEPSGLQEEAETELEQPTPTPENEQVDESPPEQETEEVDDKDNIEENGEDENQQNQEELNPEENTTQEPVTKEENQQEVLPEQTTNE